MADSDLALVRRVLNGDESAFDRLFDEAYPVMYRFALSRLGRDEETAADAAQAAICRAIARLHTYRGEASLMTWLCTFCWRELCAHWKRQGRRREIPLAEDEPVTRAALEILRRAATTDPDESLDRAALASTVRMVLEHLPVHYADALEWKYIDELPVQEIAGRLQIGSKAAESLLTRARNAFRDEFRALAPDGMVPRCEEG